MGKLERIKKEYLEVKDNVSATEFIKTYTDNAIKKLEGLIAKYEKDSAR